MPTIKQIPKELKLRFCKHLCEQIATKYELESAFNFNSGVHSFIYFTTEEHSSEEILKLINTEMNIELINFIETETGDNAKEYDRSLVLFESETNEANLTIIW